MEKGLFDIRSNLPGKHVSRIFFRVADGTMVLLHGMIRKTQTTPSLNIDLTRKRVKEVGP